MKKYIMGLGLCLFAALGTVSVSAGENAKDSLIRDGLTIMEGVSIGEVPVGSMTLDEARAAVNDYVEEVSEGQVTLVGDIGKVTVDNSDFGLEWDNDDVVEDALNLGRTGNVLSRYKTIKDTEENGCVLDLGLSVDKSATSQIFTRYADELEQGPEENTLKRENGQFVVVEGEKGSEVDISASIDSITDFFNNGWSESNNEISLVCDVVEPSISVEELQQVEDLLGTFSTDYSSSSSARKQNLANGASKIDGTVLMPGEQFSVYGAVSPFSEENGYELAGSYNNGQVVETFGGGICQVSTTLYNAVLRAELQVDERSPHSMTVHYVDLSMDAAIAGTYKDMKFTNNTDYPVYIEGVSDGYTLKFNVYGKETRDPGRTLEFISETTQTDEPKTIYSASSSAAFGSMSTTQSGRTGYSAVLWKVVYQDGEEVSREIINSSTYSGQDTIVTVGLSGGDSDSVSALKSAISSGDKSKIEAAISAGKKAEEEKEEEEEEEDSKKKDDGTDSDKKKKDDTSNNKKDNSSGQDDSSSKKKTETSEEDSSEAVE